MHNEIDETAKPTPGGRTCRLLSQLVRLGMLGVALLVAAAMGAAALNHLLPRSPKRAQSLTERLAMHIQRGGVQADMRTLVCMLEYIVTPETEFPTVTVSTNLPVAGYAAPTLFKS